MKKPIALVINAVSGCNTVKMPTGTIKDIIKPFGIVIVSKSIMVIVKRIMNTANTRTVSQENP
jgi:hypothetical protein